MAVEVLDINYYREANPDLAGVGLTTDEQLRNHFFGAGINEPRPFSRIADLGVYRASNPDLAVNGVDTNPELYNHLSTLGVAEGRRFSLFFDLSFYRAANALDLGGLGNESLFTHAQNFGVGEGRRTSAFIDLNLYRSQNLGDLGGFDNLRLFDHLRNFGARERRTFSHVVDLNFYLGANNDLAAAFGGDGLQALQHLEIFGISEGRRFSPFVDLRIYKAANPDLRAAIPNNDGLLNHLSAFGINERRRLSLSYDPVFYQSRNPDLTPANGINTGLDLLNHFQFAGISENENRVASDSFDANFYRGNGENIDLSAFSRRGALDHFEVFGFRENRLASNAPPSISVEPGDSLGSAANLGVISARRGGSITDNIDSTVGDLIDTYRLLLPTASTLNFQLSGFSGTLNTRLIFDRNGNGVFEQAFSSGEEIALPPGSPSFDRILGQGTYYIEVFNTSSTINTNYTFNLSATPFPNSLNIDPGNSLATAFNLNVGQSVINLLGPANAIDIYRFNLNTTSTVNLALDGLTGLGSDDVILELILDANNNGVIDTNEILATGVTQTSLTLAETVGPGNYYIRARRQQPNGATPYRLTLSANPVSLGPDPGNTLASALDLGTLAVGTRTVGDFVGAADPRDVYRFSLNSVRRVQFAATTSDNIEMQLVSDQNNNGNIDTGELTSFGSTNPTRTVNLVSGVTYYFQILAPVFPEDNTLYQAEIRVS